MFKNKFSKAAKASKQQPVFKQDYFNNCHRTYSCIHCRAHLANHDELISKLFQGNHGRAYLFNKVVNIGCKQAVQRELLTGLHAVADIYCDSCETTLGWKYEQAFEPSQKYKEGKYIIELVHMLKENQWDPTSYNARDLLLEEAQNSRKLIEEQQLKQRFCYKFRFGRHYNNSNILLGFSNEYLNDNKQVNKKIDDCSRMIIIQDKTRNHQSSEELVAEVATMVPLDNCVVQHAGKQLDGGLCAGIGETESPQLKSPSVVVVVADAANQKEEIDESSSANVAIEMEMVAMVPPIDKTNNPPDKPDVVLQNNNNILNLSPVAAKNMSWCSSGDRLADVTDSDATNEPVNKSSCPSQSPYDQLPISTTVNNDYNNINSVDRPTSKEPEVEDQAA